MGRGTIQQSWVRIKQRYRLFVYDAGESIVKTLASVRVWAESGRGQAYTEVISLVAVSVIAFSIGRYSVVVPEADRFIHDTTRRVVHIEPKPVASIPARGKIVVSKNGKRWHYAWCPGAETISEKNRRWYKSEAEAEKAGYSRASNCK